MQRITQQLLRKRSQHNEGMLTNLQQVSLHQQQLQKIQNLDILCRHLKILYLQNNVIQKMQNLNKLKQLQYLNLALNNISMIQNIERCESLQKLDLTLNFIDGQDIQKSMDCLQHCYNMKEIYLLGNPCLDWKACKQYVIARLPSLEVFDGTNITQTERITSLQNLQSNKLDLPHFIEMKKFQKKRKEALKNLQRQVKMRQAQQKGQQYKQDQKVGHSKQQRRKMYMQMADQKHQKDKKQNPQKYAQKKETMMFNKQGQIRQCNEGRYQFNLSQYDDPEYSFFQIQIPKFMDTSLVDLQLNPEWVSVRIKGKLTQIKFFDPIIVSESSSQRSVTTGKLKVKMKKLNENLFVQKQLQKKQKLIDQQKLRKQQKQKKQEEEKKKRLLLCEQFEQKMYAPKQKDFDEVPDLQ